MESGLAGVYGKAIGEEARYREKDVLLGPGVNIYRTPLNGRNFEYMGEDPYLAGEMVVPYVKEPSEEWRGCMRETLCAQQSGAMARHSRCGP